LGIHTATDGIGRAMPAQQRLSLLLLVVDLDLLTQILRALLKALGRAHELIIREHDGLVVLGDVKTQQLTLGGHTHGVQQVGDVAEDVRPVVVVVTWADNDEDMQRRQPRQFISYIGFRRHPRIHLLGNMKPPIYTHMAMM